MWTNKQQQQAADRTARRRGRPAFASETKRSVESQAADMDEQATAASSRQDSQTERTSSVGKKDQAISREPGGGCGRTSNSSKQPTGQTERTSSVGKREQAISREPGGQQHQRTRRMWTNNSSKQQDRLRRQWSQAREAAVRRAAGVDEQQQQATGQPDGEDSGRKRGQAISRELSGHRNQRTRRLWTNNSSKQPTGQTERMSSIGKREQAISSEPNG